MQRTRIGLHTLLILLFLIFSATVAAQKPTKKPVKGNTAKLPSVIWRGADSVGSLNLLYGAGGQDHAPDANGRYKFVKEDMGGHSPKFEAKDAQGVLWKIKMGEESHSEIAATRLLWAAGYFVDEDYFLPTIKVTGLPKLHRGNDNVHPGGTIRNVRLERKLKEVKKVASWSWFANPFVGKRELDGLRVMMALLNNWDLQAYNNSVYVVGGERRYVVNDVGATFGKTGNNFVRSKGVLKDYANSKFVDKASPEFIDFVMESRPFAASVVNYPNYKTRTHMEAITEHIPRADAKWLGQILAQLSAEQIRDCFRAGGFTSQEVEGYAAAVQKRIAELNAL
jgi:hypothetical protein